MDGKGMKLTITRIFLLMFILIVSELMPLSMIGPTNVVSFNQTSIDPGNAKGSLPPVANSWPMYRHDSNHTGQSNFDTSGNPGTLRWAFSPNGYIESSPAISNDGTIIIGCDDYSVYAIYPNGTKKWQFLTGGCVMSSPAIAPDGTIYIGSDDNKLYAIIEGVKKWEYPTSNYIRSSPMLDGQGDIYFGSDDTNLYALHPDGSLKWICPTSDYVRSTPTINTSGCLFFTSNDNLLYAVNSLDGTKKWMLPIGVSIYGLLSSPAIGQDGVIYVGSNNNCLYAVYPNGTLYWNKTISTSVFGITSSPAIGYDGTIYIGSYDNSEYAFYPNGTLKWTFVTNSWIETSGAIGDDGTIYFGSDDGKLYAIYPNGTKRWDLNLGSLGQSSPSIGADGTIYIGSSDYYMYSVGSPTTPSPPQNLIAIPADSEIQLKWQPPLYDGGYPVNNYTVYWGNISGIYPNRNVTGNVNNWVVKNLTNGIRYYFVVSAKNTLGKGLYSVEVNATPMTIPSEPRNLFAGSKNCEAALRWFPPVSDGGAAVMNYTVYWGTSSGVYNNNKTLNDRLFQNITGLVNNVTYYFAVSAANAAGEGPLSIEANCTPGLTIDDIPMVIVYAPDDGEDWIAGTKHDIEWDAWDDNILPSSPINITLSRDNGNNWEFVANYLPNDGIYNWTVTGTVTSYACKIRVSVFDSAGQQNADESNYTFTITVLKIDNPPSILILSPDGGEEWPIGTQQDVEWVATDDQPLPQTPVNISLSRDGGTTWTVIGHDLPNLGIFSWTVTGNPLSSDCFISVSIYDSTGHKVTDQSNGTFQIVDSWQTPSVAIIEPSSGDVLHGGTIYEIIFNISSGKQPYICWINYSNNGGTGYQPISDAQGKGCNLGTNLFTWIVPNANSTNCCIMIEVYGGGFGMAESDLFTILLGPPPPSDLTASAGDRQVILNWTIVNGADGYKIYRKDSPVAAWLFITNTTKTTYTDTGLVNGVTYYYSVTSMKNGVESNKSLEISAIPKVSDGGGEEINTTNLFLAMIVIVLIVITLLLAITLFTRKKRTETAVETPAKTSREKAKTGLATLAIKAGKCASCGKFYNKGDKIVICACGKKYQKECADELKVCHKCGREIRTETTIIDEVFLMYKDGRLLRHETRRLKPDVDSDILSSMLVAVQSFIKDSFKGEEGGLDEMKFGELKVLIGRGKWVIIAALIMGEEIDPLRPQITKVIKEMEEKYPGVLRKWDGVVDDIAPLTKFLRDLIDGKYK